MTIQKCAVFFDEGSHQVLYSCQGDLETNAKAYIRQGVPFLIIDVSDLPPRETRADWSFNYSNPSGFGENV
jgi:hypothetical protein